MKTMIMNLQLIEVRFGKQSSCSLCLSEALGDRCRKEKRKTKIVSKSDVRVDDIYSEVDPALHQHCMVGPRGDLMRSLPQGPSPIR